MQVANYNNIKFTTLTVQSHSQEQKSGDNHLHRDVQQHPQQLPSECLRGHIAEVTLAKR